MGTLLGTAGFATGFGGGPDQALNLDGSGYDSLGGGAALISIPALTFASTTNGTVEMWVQAGWTDLNSGVFYALVSSTAYSMNYSILMTGDKSAIVFWNDTAWQTFPIPAPGTNWHHLAVAIAPAGANCTCTVIWDGVSLGTATAPWASGLNNTVQLGTPSWNGSANGAAGNWIGKLDEVAFYSTHLPVSSIQAHYAASTGPMIHIAPSGASVAISWSAFGNWVLESAPQLPAVMKPALPKAELSPCSRFRKAAFVGSRLNLCTKTIGAVCWLLLGLTTLQAQEGRLLYDADFSSLPVSKLKLTKDWSAQDGLRLQSTNWWWETATLAFGTNDYQLDAVVDICSNGAGKGNGAGFVFRKSAAKSAVFYLSQNLAGYAALAELLGKPPEAKPEPPAPATNPQTNHAFQILPEQGRRLTREELRGRKAGYKDSVYALSKDKEVGWRHLRAVVKGKLANFYVDDQLACILDLTDYPGGEVGLYGLHQVVFKSFTVRALASGAKVVSSRPMRELLPNNKIYPAQRSWTSTVANAGAVLDQAMAEGTADVPGDERMPAYTYRCVTYMKPGVKPFYAYPAFHHTLVQRGVSS